MVAALGLEDEAAGDVASVSERNDDSGTGSEVAGTVAAGCSVMVMTEVRGAAVIDKVSSVPVTSGRLATSLVEP